MWFCCKSIYEHIMDWFGINWQGGDWAHYMDHFPIMVYKTFNCPYFPIVLYFHMPLWNVQSIFFNMLWNSLENKIQTFTSQPNVIMRCSEKGSYPILSYVHRDLIDFLGPYLFYKCHKWSFQVPILAGRVPIGFQQGWIFVSQNLKLSIRQYGVLCNYLKQGWIYVQKNLKLSILEFGVFWNCLSWSTRKSSKLSIET